jgi:hypothetical protein
VECHTWWDILYYQTATCIGCCLLLALFIRQILLSINLSAQFLSLSRVRIHSEIPVDDSQEILHSTKTPGNSFSFSHQGWVAGPSWLDLPVDILLVITSFRNSLQGLACCCWSSMFQCAMAHVLSQSPRREGGAGQNQQLPATFLTSTRLMVSVFLRADSWVASFGE